MANKAKQPSPKDFVTNWNQPYPLRTKLKMLVRNMGRRIVLRQNCCGHDGEPGC
jgi:hypothetical protein